MQLGLQSAYPACMKPWVRAYNPSAPPPMEGKGLSLATVSSRPTWAKGNPVGGWGRGRKSKSLKHLHVQTRFLQGFVFGFQLSNLRYLLGLRIRHDGGLAAFPLAVIANGQRQLKGKRAPFRSQFKVSLVAGSWSHGPHSLGSDSDKCSHLLSFLNSVWSQGNFPASRTFHAEKFVTKVILYSLKLTTNINHQR